MFELPEMVTLARQVNETIQGKIIWEGHLGNSPHKFVWYNRKPEEFTHLTGEKTIGEAHVRGRWLFIPLEPGYVLVLGECGGKILYHPSGVELPKKYHLWLAFEDGSALTTLTQMWGAMELFEAGLENERQYIKDMRRTPTDPDFSFDYFSGLIDEVLRGEKRSVKSLLTQDQLIPGLGVRGRAIWWSKSEINCDMRRKKDGLRNRGARFCWLGMTVSPGQSRRWL